MSEISEVLATDLTPAGHATVPVSAGAMIRNARVAAGLHIGALAVSLKIPVKKLEALEADRFDLLPDAVFIRALASSVCRALKIDPQPILTRLPQTAAPMLRADGSGINVPFRPADLTTGWQFWRQLPKSFVAVVSALMLGVLVLVFFPFEDRGESSNAVGFNGGFWRSSRVSAEAPVTAEAAATVAVPTSSQPVTPEPLRSSAVMSSTLEMSSAATPAAVVSTAQVTPNPSDPSAAVLLFRASGVSWVEVVDANRVVQLRRLLSDGEVVGASGALPLSVVIGRSNTTQVQVRGKPFDLASITRDNVARFEVK